MSGNRCLHRNGCSLAIPNLTNHDYIRVLPKDTAQGGCKGQAGFGINLYLINTVNVSLHRVFNRNNIHITGIQLAKSSVKSCGLTATGRSRYQYNTVRIRKNPVKLLHIILKEPEMLLLSRQGLL